MRFLLVALFALVASDAFAADAPALKLEGTTVEQAGPNSFALGTPLTLFWPPVDNEAATQVSRYEMAIDTGAFAAAGQSIPTRPEYSTQLPQPALTLGDHTLRVRACNVQRCGDAGSITVSIVLPVPSTPLPGVRPSASEALREREAIYLANGFAAWALMRDLSRTELELLEIRHANKPLTREALLSTLVAAYNELRP